MRILFVGFHNPHFTNSFVYREKAIEALGHELIYFEDRDYLIPGRFRMAFDFLQQWDQKRLNRNLVKLAENKRADLCLVVGGYAVLPGTIKRIKETGTPTALWTTDPPVQYKKGTQEVPRDYVNLIKAAPFYDFLICSGTEYEGLFKSAGCQNVHWSTFACDPNYHHPIELSPEDISKYGRDIVFVGSYYPNRARILEKIADLDIGVWGPYWSNLNDNSLLKEKAVSVKMNYSEWIKIYSAAKINIVIHYDDGKTPCYQASPKLFETMACGSFVMVDREKDVLKLFKDKEHLVYFDDERDLRKKITYYLRHSEERKRIAEQGRREVLEKHTYQHRIKQVLNICAQ